MDKIRNTEQVDKIPEIRLLLAEFERSKEASEYGPHAEGDAMLQLDGHTWNNASLSRLAQKAEQQAIRHHFSYDLCDMFIATRLAQKHQL